jgi:ribosomal protein S18 acetylase RimI-like enzyme
MHKALTIISRKDKDVLDIFLSLAGRSLLSFRYYKTRTFAATDKHLVTSFIMDNNIPVAYGHLDEEDNIIWLGVCVLEQHTGKGLGYRMTKHLISYAESKSIDEIKLSVDKDNVPAIKLYEKCGFLVFDENQKSYFMKLTKNNISEDL